MPVDRLGDQFFSSTALALDQDCGIARRHLAYGLEDATEWLTDGDDFGEIGVVRLKQGRLWQVSAVWMPLIVRLHTFLEEESRTGPGRHEGEESCEVGSVLSKNLGNCAARTAEEKRSHLPSPSCRGASRLLRPLARRPAT